MPTPLAGNVLSQLHRVCELSVAHESSAREGRASVLFSPVLRVRSLVIFALPLGVGAAGGCLLEEPWLRVVRVST
jgi:hypothetical protein